jgi:hypothetical protein
MLATVMIALVIAAQDTTQRTDTASPPPPQVAPPPAAPATPTPEQARYLSGLRTVSRGVAQLRDGIDRVTRTQQLRDSVRLRQAGRRLGGLCTTARSFIASGRPRMVPTAYEDTMRVIARALVVRLDSVTKYLPTCETTAGKTPGPVAADLTKRLQAFDLALVAFRTAGAPPKTDSIKTPS